MNYFFALEVPDEAHQTVAALVDNWKRLLEPFQHSRWYGPDDYHITLKFLGDLPETALPQLILTTASVAEATTPFSVTLSGIGMFPERRFPKVLWVGIVPSASLSGLAAAIDTTLSAYDYALERRIYKPHITVARCRFSIEGEEWPIPDEQVFAKFTINRFVLMQTLPPDERRNNSKSRYNIVHTFPFSNLQ